MSQGTVDWTAPHNGTETSRAAAESIKHRISADARRIHERLSVTPEGLCCDEVELLLGLSHQTASARLHGLLRSGIVYHFGTRETRTGRRARIYFISSNARKNA